jgi:hypothetical protein
LQSGLKAAFCASVAGGADRIDEQEQGVAVAVNTNFADMLDVAGGSAFVPQFLAAAAPEVGFASFLSKFEGCGVHPGDHEDLLGGMMLQDGRYQPPIIKFQT